MAQAASKQSEQAGDDLADQIDSLISDLGTSERGGGNDAGHSEASIGAVGDADEARAETTEADVEALAAQVDELVGEVERAAQGRSDPATDEEPGEAESAALGGAETRTAGGDEPTSGEAESAGAGVAAAPDVPEANESVPELSVLDEQLAASAGPVVAEGDNDDLLSAAAIISPDPLDGSEAAFESVEDIGDRDAAEPKAAPVVKEAPAPAAKVRLGSLVGLGARGTRAVLGAGLAWSSKAYAKAPAVVQDTIGWIGLVTVFFGGCLWVSVLFFRGAPTPEVYGVPSAVLEPGDPTPQPKPRPSTQAQDDGHGESAGGHGGEQSGHGGAEASHGGGGNHGSSGGGHGGGGGH